MNEQEPLERILAREWDQTLSPYAYYTPPHIQRLIDARWLWQRMSVKGYWIMGWTELGWAAATVCGLCDKLAELSE